MADVTRTLAAFMVVMVALSAHGTRAAADLHYRLWTTDDGLPTASVRDIAQTGDGYLWIATLDGLVRFDGVRMRVFQRDEVPGMTSNRCLALHVDRRGRLWVGTEDGGVFRVDGTTTHPFGVRDGVPRGLISSFAEDGRGRLWIETQEGSAYFENDRFTPVPRAPEGTLREDGELFSYPASVLPDRTRGFLEILLPGPARWLPTGSGTALRFRGGKVESVTWPPVPPPLRLAQEMTPVLERGDGKLWVLQDGYLRMRENGAWHLYSTPIPGALLPRPRVLSEDREGSLWIVGDGGIVQATPAVVRGLEPQGPEAERVVYTLAQDDAGRVWATTQGRVQLLQNESWTAQGGGPSWPDGWITALRADGGGAVLVAGSAGIFRVVPGRRVESLNAAGSEYHDVLRDRAGRVWAGGLGGLVRQTSSGWETVSGLPSPDVKVLLEGKDGAIWVGTYGGLARVSSDGVATWTAANGLSSDRIRCLHEDSSGALWIGTYDGGLNRFAGGRFTHIGKSDGLYDNGVFAILEDGDDRFWMSCNRGVYAVPRRDLDAFAAGSARRVACLAWRSADGMPTSECNGGRQPSGLRAKDGTIWFPTQRGVAVFDPRAIRTNALPPPVVIEEVTTDRRSFPVGAPVELAPGERRLEVRYAANTFVHPEGARFRHRLTGFDDDWVDAGDRRFVQYAQIPPGRYTLRVIAANGDGVWNDEGAMLAIRVLPFWWQTAWFRWGGSLLVLGLVAGAYRRRVSILDRRRAEQDAFARRLIESQEAERKRIAGELHDGIGQTLAAIRNQALLGQRAGIDPLRQIAEISDAAEEGVEEVRKIAYGLRPYQIDRLGLKRALDAVIEQTAASSAIPIDAQVDDVGGLFRPEDEINVYRILQEGLNNLVRHARATRGRVAVVVSDASVEITIADDGVGFDAATLAAGKGGLGLSGIAERARILGGRSAIRSSPGEGTVVTVTLPLGDER